MPNGPPPIRLAPTALSLPPGAHDVASVLRSLSARPGLVALDSVGGAPRRYSLVGFDPFEEFGVDSPAPQTLEQLEARLAQLDAPAPCDLGPFAGGFLGAFGYELGVAGETLALPEPAWPQPPIVGGLYADWILFEHDASGVARHASVIACDGVPGLAPARERIESVLADLARPTPTSTAGPAGAPRRTVPSSVHRERVDRVRSFIERGEIYQANLSHRMECDIDGDALDLYLALREVNPAPYMGFLRFPMPGGATGAIVSASPELLLELSTSRAGERIARTRPIKGTIARGKTLHSDAFLRAALAASDKDRAELAMIVDLERNDLGRIATAGGVRVGEFPTLESYASVHHLVCDVSATVRDDVTAVGVIGALFPGGSITGAPKLRSMEVIAELEGEGRGFFTGSLGFVDARGHAALNILIRTFVHRAGGEDPPAVSFHVGGGITWRSDPAAEDHETLLKAEGLLRALRVPGEPQ